MGLVSSTVLLVALSGLAMGDGSSASTPARPASASLLVSEVETGAASASEEFIELSNGGAAPADLAGLEVA